jgi:hypothetical protein
MNGERVALGLIILIFASIFLFHGKPGSINGLTPVEQKAPRFHLFRNQGDGDGTFKVQIPGTITDGASNRSGSFVLYGGRLFEDPLDPSSLRATFTPDYYFVDTDPDQGLDLGTWAAYRPGSTEDTSGFQVGIRYSPVRLAWGTLSTDLVASADVVGAGFSLYPPPQFVGGWWRHIGLGAWYTVPFGDDTDRSTSEWCYGLSFTTRD